MKNQPSPRHGIQRPWSLPAPKALRLATIAALSLCSLTLSSVSHAADPIPQSGPIAGGTKVTLEQPKLAVKASLLGAGQNASFVTSNNGQTFSWGNNYNGSAGLDTSDGVVLEPTPMELPDGVSFVDVVSGYKFSVGLSAEGELYTWGNTPTNGIVLKPTLLTAPSGVKFSAVSLSDRHVLAIGDNGNTYAWGENSSGQLGDGTTTDASGLVQVNVPTGVTFSAVAAGTWHSLALGNDGKTYAWGSGDFWVLGNGAEDASITPTPVTTPVGVTFTSISADEEHSVAIANDGSVYAWGSGSSGRLGNGSIEASPFPTRVLLPEGVSATSISTGAAYTLAVGDDGNTYSWGDGDRGQLGVDHKESYSSVPLAVQQPAGVTFIKVRASNSHALAIGDNGALYGWGYNTWSQLGFYNDYALNEASWTPIQLTLPTFSGAATKVLFGSKQASFTTNPDSSLAVTAPAQDTCGPVDITVEWEIDGTPQTPLKYADGFTYTGAPVLSAPKDVATAPGKTVTFTTEASVCPADAVTWEESQDGGTTWQPVPVPVPAAAAAPSTTHTLTVVAASEKNGNLYRPVTTFEGQLVTAAAAELTVSKSASRTPTPPSATPKANDQAELAHTGTPAGMQTGIIGATALLLSSGALMMYLRRRHAHGA